jgi:HEAT repeat protein
MFKSESIIPTIRSSHKRNILLRLVVVGLSAGFLLADGAPDANVAAARRVLREGLVSHDSVLRVQTVIAASMIGENEEVVKHLEGVLKDKDVAVRITAIHALADLNSLGSVSVLEEILKKDNVPEVQFAAAKALYALKNSAGKQTLYDVFNKKFDSSSNLLQTEARDFFHKFHSARSTVSFIVSEGIGYVPVPGVGEGFSAMTEILSDPDLSDRASVVLLLGREKNAESDAMLSAGVKDGDWSVRASSAQMIAHTARVGMINLLPNLFTDKEPKVRFRAAGAYLHLYLEQATNSH